MAIILAFFLSKKEYEKVSKKGGCYVNIIIYDDSEKDRARLKKLIRQYEPKLEKNIVITEYSSGERGDLDDLIADIHQNRQELLYRFVEGEKRLRIEDIMYIETSRHKNLFKWKRAICSEKQISRSKKTICKPLGPFRKVVQS